MRQKSRAMTVRQNDSATVKQNGKATEQHKDAQADGFVKPLWGRAEAV
jgi:hypothetical protein